ncbi:MAG TPA: hypothetical protein VIN03_20120, partial [Roseateles sp.]
GYIVHGTRDSLAQSNVADVYNSILNMAGFFGYDTQNPTAPNAIEGYRVMSSFGVGFCFAACTLCMLANKLNKQTTLKMANDLAQRRLQAGLVPA